jgi:hypothetical protein
VDLFEQLVRFAVEDFVAAADGELSERFCAVTFAETRRTDEQRILARLDELQCRKL